MLNSPSANGLRSLQKLTIEHSYLSVNDYDRLATVLERAPNLRALAVMELEGHLSRNDSRLADSIVALRDLHDLELQDIGEKGLELCRRLTCRPDTVRLKGDVEICMEDLQGTMVHFAVNRTALLGLPVFQHASTVVLDGFSFLPKAGPPSLRAPVDPWSETRTLSLTNMDPLAVAAVCPNLTHLRLGYFCPEDDHFEEFVHDREYPWSTDTLGDTLGLRVRALDVYVDSEQSMTPRAFPVTIRATRPVVLSVRFPAEASALWEELARALQGAGSRARHLDVVLLRDDQPRRYLLTVNGRAVGAPLTSPQQWLVRPALGAALLVSPSLTHCFHYVARRRSACPSSSTAVCCPCASASQDPRPSASSPRRSTTKPSHAAKTRCTAAGGRKSGRRRRA